MYGTWCQIVGSDMYLHSLAQRWRKHASHARGFRSKEKWAIMKRNQSISVAPESELGSEGIEKKLSLDTLLTPTAAATNGNMRKGQASKPQRPKGCLKKARVCTVQGTTRQAKYVKY